MDGIKNPGAAAPGVIAAVTQQGNMIVLFA